MAMYQLWGQVQQITPTQYLLLASASPLAAGSSASIIRTAASPLEAQREMKNVLAELDRQLRNRGDEVLVVAH